MYQIDFKHPVRVYFVGIGGISMSGLAQILASEGFTVSGSDRAESAATQELEACGIKVLIGQKAENITDDIDLAVFTAAIHPDNPEYKAVHEKGIPCLSRAELLGQLMKNYRLPVAVSGTHGKTTTTSMLSEVLLAADVDPTLSIGGFLSDIGSNVRIGNSGYFVAEACEYTNSFLHMFPGIGIILNIEEDHLDFFKDLSDIRHSFRRFAELMEAGMTDYMIQTIDSLTALLDESQQLNYKKWGINTKMYHEIVLYSSYSAYIRDLKNFIVNHCEYLSEAFANKKLPEPTPPFAPGNYYYRILNAGTNDALDIVNQNVEPGGLVCTWSNLEGRESEEWQIRKYGEYYHLTNRMGDVALADPTQGEVGPTVNTGTQLATAEPDTLDDRQLWLLTPQGTNGYYNLTNKYTQHTANLSGGSTADGASVLSYTTDNRNSVSNNRLWYIVRGEELPVPDAINGVEPEEYALAYNPQTEVLHFGSETPEQLTFMVDVYSVGGHKVKAFRADENCSVADLSSGVYIVTWKCGAKIRSVKFMKR